MKVVITIEHRFDRTPDGKVWTYTTCPYSFWKRYLDVFEHVRVIARLREVSSVPSDFKRADGEGVSFASVPYYIGPWQYLQRFHQVKRVAKNAVGAEDAVILRVGSPIAALIQPFLHRSGHPYGVEVVADPYDAFAPGSVKHPLRPFFRWLSPRQLQNQCVKACAAAYVTQYALQHRYPPAKEAFSTHYSSVELLDTAFVSFARSPQQEMSRLTLITVGTLAQLYKAPDILIKAVAACVKEGLDLELILIGDGKHRPELERLTKNIGLGTRVNFLGQLPAGDAVRTQLDQADLFILPSYQEGLPRAMIEAMARGLPCIGSTVGGIPELLPPEDMVPPGDVVALANKIREVVNNPERMAQMSARNLEKAKDYRQKILRDRRIVFYRYVREKTEQYILQGKAI
ncbi:glycosyltransferase family 4 protein [Aetokthonos hydrillicola Thurmond2011]|jgi:glycosyltransferase involved in cell wall biosynthesis|uniref:Glycosyltransferase family 4 protein n=1 Tax=Aetokthonos hydrillicola Thurmond2011 TaxID=2712845 RepID=A0AAP5MDU3_9CYAN|nr:glycosyltransferase family 4 protein [Aetokthonos hydrillicola]MBO3460073.1 glycosyltransferase family 4 protein [Aetokthonos hydrillicola CCALA 1050]MBW4589528.1 glycosyltransferase family 4 protein [Aetokthonos hydrillicola CCALA 1050]MDR9899824.1 glycosyltransferase family 4 protein [Aetokthonos hydrillicola Thurmond2011]